MAKNKLHHISDLIAHVGCGSLDEAGNCGQCDIIRAILKQLVPPKVRNGEEQL